jgi:hypothetical protein
MVAAGSLEAAKIGAREVRDSGVLSFVEAGSNYRLRRASRTEVSLLAAFLSSCRPPQAGVSSRADVDALISRRQRLLMSFFLALYIDPVGLKRRLRVDQASSPDEVPPGSGSGSGGVEASSADKLMETGGMAAADTPEAAGNEQSSGGQGQVGGMKEGVVSGGAESAEAGDAPPGASALEGALASILSGPEANDGGVARDHAVDLEW